MEEDKNVEATTPEEEVVETPTEGAVEEVEEDKEV